MSIEKTKYTPRPDYYIEDGSPVLKDFRQYILDLYQSLNIEEITLSDLRCYLLHIWPKIDNCNCCSNEFDNFEQALDRMWNAFNNDLNIYVELDEMANMLMCLEFNQRPINKEGSL